MFTHFHCHSDRTIGKALLKPQRLVDRYLELGASAACITDNGNLCGAIQLYNAAKKKAIKPIIGIEVNIAVDRKKKDQKTTTLVLIAKNLAGFRNLVKIATVGSMYFYYLPRVDLEVLKKYSEGVICLTSDTKGYVAESFFRLGVPGIEQAYEGLTEIFKEVYWEIQPTQSESQRVFNSSLLEVAKGFDAFKLLATADVYYILESERDFHKKYILARNSRNPYREYTFKGPNHITTDEEIWNYFDLLHGEGFVKANIEIQDSIYRNIEVVNSIESYDLREGTKVPTFVE